MKRLLTLTDDEREQIARRYKQEKNPRFRERLQCLLLKDRGLTNGEVADLLLVVPETITDWLNLYEDGGVEALCRLETGGSDGFLTGEQITMLNAELDKHVFQTAKQVCAWVQEQFAVTYSERGMRDLAQTPGLHPTKSPSGSRPSRCRGAGGFFKRSMKQTKTTRTDTERVVLAMRFTSCTMCIRAACGPRRDSARP